MLYELKQGIIIGYSLSDNSLNYYLAKVTNDRYLSLKNLPLQDATSNLSSVLMVEDYSQSIIAVDRNVPEMVDENIDGMSDSYFAALRMLKSPYIHFALLPHYPVPLRRYGFYYHAL